MIRIFHAGERQAQSQWHTEALWDDARKKKLLLDHIPPEFHPRLESAPFFFLATADAQGNCDCSFKGGGPGLIRIVNERCFLFPDFSGNGAFMSLGNILLNPHVGCLFIDFNDGARLRINGRAEIIQGEAARPLFPDAERVIRVHVDLVVPNCAQHIPRLRQVD